MNEFSLTSGYICHLLRSKEKIEQKGNYLYAYPPYQYRTYIILNITKT